MLNLNSAEIVWGLVHTAQAEALLAALHAKHEETGGHVERVVRLALRLAREVGLAPERLRGLELGALLHDVGKLYVPDEILKKPARLTDPEKARMQGHPTSGAVILRRLTGFPEGAARVVAEHHEWWDGTGYPHGLRGEEIALEARIFSVADTFDAITCDRCYRKGASYGVARQEINDWSGRQFDPAVVQAFNRVPPEEWAEEAGE